MSGRQDGSQGMTDEEMRRQLADQREFVANLQFPDSMNRECIEGIMEQMKVLRQGGMISEELYNEKHALALKKLCPGGAPASSAGATAQQAGVAGTVAETITGTLVGHTTQLMASEGRKNSKEIEKRKLGEGCMEDGSFRPRDDNYFECYADFSHQELMLNDTVRTGTYYSAITFNAKDLNGKVVVDVGSGTGILAMFAARAGARKVYAIEASDMAVWAKRLVEANHLSHIVEIVHGRVEEVELPEKADVMISEPLGFWLLNEQMVQSYVRGRDRFMKKGGLMLPSYVDFCIAPGYLPDIWEESQSGGGGWAGKSNFFGLDFSPLEKPAKDQVARRIVVDQIVPSAIKAPPTVSKLDLNTITAKELDNLLLPFNFEKRGDGLKWDSVVMWFDTVFEGSTVVTLPTAPDKPLTCWYQSVIPMPEACKGGFSGDVSFDVNMERTYAVTVKGKHTDVDAALQVERDVDRTYQFTSPVYRYYSRPHEINWHYGSIPEQDRVWGYEEAPTPME